MSDLFTAEDFENLCTLPTYVACKVNKIYKERVLDKGVVVYGDEEGFNLAPYLGTKIQALVINQEPYKKVCEKHEPVQKFVNVSDIERSIIVCAKCETKIKPINWIECE